MVLAIAKEAEFRRLELQRDQEIETMETIYFGGVTPSLLTDNELDFIFERIHEHYSVSEDAEITLEANPDDITKERALEWLELGINRISVGIQSFEADDLAWMNRAHKVEQALNAIPILKSAGFENITADLIYGLPGRTLSDWQRNVETLLAFNIPHFSAYALTVEPKTPLAKAVKEGRITVVKEGEAEQFLALQDWARTAGYEPYEISSYGKPGWRSRHNSSYWDGKAYLGLGPSAHSFDGESVRQWNVRSNAVYLQAILGGKETTKAWDHEVLSRIEQFNEHVMLQLRRIEGLDMQKIAERFGVEALESVEQALAEALPEWLNKDGNRVWLTDVGRLFADRLASEAMLLEE